VIARNQVVMDNDLITATIEATYVHAAASPVGAQ